MPESNSTLDLLRSALAGETNPHMQLVLLEHGRIFCNLSPDLRTDSSKASRQKAVSSVLESFQNSTARVCQSITATRQAKLRPIGM